MCKKENQLPIKKQNKSEKKQYEENWERKKRNQKYNEERKTSEKQSITKEKKKKNQTKARDCTNGPAQFSEYPLDPLKVQNRAGSVSSVCWFQGLGVQGLV